MKEVFKSKRLYILIALIVLALIVIFLVPKKEKPQLVQNYNIEMQNLYQEYAQGQNNKARLEELKAELFEIIVPKEYKDSHLRLVLLADKIQNLRKSGDLDQTAGLEEELLNKLKSY